MNDVARKALERLLGLAENAAAKSGSRQVSLRLSASSFPAYLAIPSAANKGECNADLQVAEKAGAIHVEWDAAAQEKSHAVRLLLRDAEALARHLGVRPRWAAVAAAAEQLAEARREFPVMAEVLDCWRRGATARGTTPDDAQDWSDAVRVLKQCQSTDGQDIPVRRLSASLFGDSKRVERLWPMLDVLSHGSSLSTPQSDPEEVFSELGLVKFPPTLLVSFDGYVRTPAGAVQAVQPYIGLPPSAVEAVQSRDGLHTLLSVENLTTFHELARARSQKAGVAVVYTAGMPSPSWLRVYETLLAALPSDGGVFHAGDRDAGGFRIAAHLAARCARVSRRLLLHAMALTAQDAAIHVRPLTKAEVGQIHRICDKWAWHREASAVASYPYVVEQESLALSWPTGAGGESQQASSLC